MPRRVWRPGWAIAASLVFALALAGAYAGWRGWTNSMMLGDHVYRTALGEQRTIEPAGPRYLAVYEIDDPSVLVSAAWATAVEEGRWSEQVRPFTRNRAHALYEVR